MKPSGTALAPRDSSPAQDELVSHVVAGLRHSPPRLSPIWFYDRLGSQLFDQICELDEYYPTRTELAIMRAHAAEMARALGPQVALIELGSGSSLKTRLLLDHLERPAAYVPVDISRQHMLEASRALARDYPRLRIVPVCADFTRPFELPGEAREARRRVVYFPGSTIGNFTRRQSTRLLKAMRDLVGEGGGVLIGVDLRKDAGVLERAYNDAKGVTAKFNLNALRHLNAELGSDFDLQAFEHRAPWVDAESRIEMHLVSKRDQTVRVGGEAFDFPEGSYLLTEYSHKYSLEDFAAIAAEVGWAVCRVWMDEARMFSVQLLEKG